MKLKAFTIFELLIVLGISGVIISATWYTLRINENLWNGFRENLKNQSDEFYFEKWINNDWENAGLITQQSQNLIFENGESQIIYRFTDKLVERIDIEKSVVVYNKKIQLGDPQLIGNLVFSLPIEAEKFSFVLTKDYDAYTLVTYGH